MIHGECQSGSFDELLSFGKERQKLRTRVFASVPQGETFDLLFIDKTQQMMRLRRWPSSTAWFYSLGAN
jgi:predicted ATPase